MRKEMKFSAQMDNVGEAVAFIEESLKQTSLEQLIISKNTLAAEEMLVQMINNADSEQSIVTIRINVNKKKAKLNISCKGAEWKLEEMETLRAGIDFSGFEDEQTAIISNMLIRSLSDNLKLRYSHGINFASLVIQDKSNKQNKAVFIFMLSGIALGLILRFLLPEGACDFTSDNIFSVGSTIFMNAVSMIVAPLVFFSIAEGMMGFSDYKVFGKISGKIIGLYFLTTAIAICISFIAFGIFKPGNPSQRDAVMAMAGAADAPIAHTLSIREILTGIVPENLANAFVSSDMLQIIFVAILTGIASTLLGEYSEPVQKFIKVANSLFMQMTNLILKFLPLGTFCFMADSILTTNPDSLASLSAVFILTSVTMLVMIFIYAILLLISKINPISFFRGFRKAMITAFTTASSNATISTSMKSLDEMGVAPKVYSFSVPLGATINMDGSSICYVMSVLFMMRIFGIQMSTSMLLSLFITVMLLSISSPGIPGAAVALTAMLFTQFGIPAGAVGYVVPLVVLADFERTMSNVTGDAVVTTIVAKSEGLLDMTKLNKK